ncbi:MAG: hypothetical protein MI919_39035 [Holophagales bacterium]|nr:hypothetical protein [Holophagales bacterium]
MGILSSILLFFGGAVALIGYVWIVVLGFRVSVAQGLSLLVFSRGMRRFASQYPQETRIPMILLIGGGAFLLGGGWLATSGEPEPDYFAEAAAELEEAGEEMHGEKVAAASFGGGLAADGAPDGAGNPSDPSPAAPGGSAYLPPQPPAPAPADDFGVAEGRGSHLPAPSSPALPRGFRAAPRTQASASAPKQVAAHDAGQLLNHRVKVVKKSGNTFRGKLSRVDGEKVIVRQWFGGGSMEISVLLDDIERIERVD